MADSNILIQLEVIQKGNKLSVVAKDTEKLSKSTDKAAKSSEKLEKQSGKTYGRFQQGAIGTANATKSFSKLNQTIGGGGSGGAGALVGAYAVLAANIFAVTAAFNAFRGAAGVDKLTEGLQEFSNTTGQSLDLVARRLQETTGNAVSFEQAMRTAALSTSAGFGTEEMEGLTRVAKGASLALGRDMGDALDRLTRGAIKLEPEILDELGIMVRLDDATESFAATLGKTAGTLTRFERQQAFMNAIITEGEEKFGAIADAIDPNVYDQLSASFADLSKNVLSLINFFLEPLIGLLIKMPTVFLGAVAIFSGGIIKRMVPAFGDMAASAKNAAAAATLAIKDSIQAGAGQQAEIAKTIKANKESLPAFDKVFGKIRQGTANTKELTSAQRSLGQRLSKLRKDQKALGKGQEEENAALQTRIDLIVKTKDKISQMQNVQAGAKAERALGIAKANEAFAAREIDLIAESQRQTFGYKDKLKQVNNVFKGVSASAKQYFVDLVNVNTAQNSGGKSALFFRNALAFLKTGFKTAGLAARTFGVMLLNAIPVIGQLIFFGSLLFEAFKKVAKFAGFFTEESAAARDAQKDLDGVLDGVADKMATIADIQERATVNTAVLTKEFKILGGLTKTIADEAVRSQRAFDDAGEGIDSITIRRPEDSGSGRNKIKADVISGRNLENVLEVSAFAQGLEALEDAGGQAASTVNEVLGGSLENFISKMKLAGQSNKELQLSLKNALFAVNETLDGVSQVAESLGTTFTEAEKEVGKFLRKTAESTAFDQIIANLGTAENQIEELFIQAGEAGASGTALLGEQVLKLGSNMRQLLGGDVQEISRNVSSLQTKLKIQQEELKNLSGDDFVLQEARIEFTEQLIKNQQILLGEAVNKELPTRLAIFRALQKEELSQKATMKLVKERIKGNKSVTEGAAAVLALNELQNIGINAQIRLLRIQRKSVEGATNEAIRKQKEGIELTKEEQALLDADVGRQKEILALQRSKVDETVIAQEAALASLKLTEKELNVRKELNSVINTGLSLEQEIFDLRMKSFGFESGDIAAKSAQKTLEIELQKLEFAREDANLKFSIIQAEFDLLTAKRAEQKSINDRDIAQLKVEQEQRIRDENSLAALRESLDDRRAKAEELRDKNSLFLSKSDSEFLSQFSRDEAKVAGETSRLDVGKTTQDLDEEIGILERVNEAQQQTIVSQAAVLKNQEKIRDKTIENIDTTIDKAKAIMSSKLGEDLFEQLDGGTVLFTQIDEFFGGIGSSITENGINFEGVAASLGQLSDLFSSTFGEEGIILSTMTSFAGSIANTISEVGKRFTEINDDNEMDATQKKLEKVAAVTQGVANGIAALSQMQQARAKAAEKAIDKEIAAEKKRDGKSEQSKKKIAAMEAQKEQIKRKAFEQEKKANIASVIMNTAVGIMKGIAQGGLLGFAMAGVIAAMGAAQLASIKGMTYQGGGDGAADTGFTPTKVEMGSRTSEVDVSQRANRGELAYLRGAAGTGNIQNFTPLPAAAGRKGYAMGSEGVVVGERGPEVISPSIPVDITPNDQIGRATTNVNFTIHAVDAAGLEQTIQSQRGNIIGMIREAANGYGENFLEQVDIDTLDTTGGSY